MILRRYIAGLDDLTDEQFYCADFNEDDDVTMADVNLIRRYIAGLIDIMSNPNMPTRGNGIRFDLDDSTLLSMTDEEFLRYLFGDVDFDTMKIKTFN